MNGEMGFQLPSCVKLTVSALATSRGHLSGMLQAGRCSVWLTHAAGSSRWPLSSPAHTTGTLPAAARSTGAPRASAGRHVSNAWPAEKAAAAIDSYWSCYSRPRAAWQTPLQMRVFRKRGLVDGKHKDSFFFFFWNGYMQTSDTEALGLRT